MDKRQDGGWLNEWDLKGLAKSVAEVKKFGFKKINVNDFVPFGLCTANCQMIYINLAKN